MRLDFERIWSETVRFREKSVRPRRGISRGSGYGTDHSGGKKYECGYQLKRSVESNAGEPERQKQHPDERIADQRE
jgi:hypothetical protein